MKFILQVALMSVLIIYIIIDIANYDYDRLAGSYARSDGHRVTLSTKGPAYFTFRDGEKCILFWKSKSNKLDIYAHGAECYVPSRKMDQIETDWKIKYNIKDQSFRLSDENYQDVYFKKIDDNPFEKIQKILNL